MGPRRPNRPSHRMGPPGPHVGLLVHPMISSWLCKEAYPLRLGGHLGPSGTLPSRLSWLWVCRREGGNGILCQKIGFGKDAPPTRRRASRKVCLLTEGFGLVFWVQPDSPEGTPLGATTSSWDDGPEERDLFRSLSSRTSNDGVATKGTNDGITRGVGDPGFSGSRAARPPSTWSVSSVSCVSPAFFSREMAPTPTPSSGPFDGGVRGRVPPPRRAGFLTETPSPVRGT